LKPGSNRIGRGFKANTAPLATPLVIFKIAIHKYRATLAV
jgi:hypothetical protein